MNEGLRSELECLEQALLDTQSEYLKKQSQIFSKEAMCQFLSERPWITLFTEAVEHSIPAHFQVVSEAAIDSKQEYIHSKLASILDPFLKVYFRDEPQLAKAKKAKPASKSGHLVLVFGTDSEECVQAIADSVQ